MTARKSQTSPRERPGLGPAACDLLNRKPWLTTALAEEEHVYCCPACGQVVDRRRLGDVLHHERPGHRPIGEAAQD